LAAFRSARQNLQIPGKFFLGSMNMKRLQFLVFLVFIMVVGVLVERASMFLYERGSKVDWNQIKKALVEDPAKNDSAAVDTIALKDIPVEKTESDKFDAPVRLSRIGEPISTPAFDAGRFRNVAVGQRSFENLAPLPENNVTVPSVRRRHHETAPVSDLSSEGRTEEVSVGETTSPCTEPVPANHAELTNTEVSMPVSVNETPAPISGVALESPADYGPYKAPTPHDAPTPLPPVSPTPESAAAPPAVSAAIAPASPAPVARQAGSYAPNNPVTGVTLGSPTNFDPFSTQQIQPPPSTGTSEPGKEPNNARPAGPTVPVPSPAIAVGTPPSPPTTFLPAGQMGIWSASEETTYCICHLKHVSATNLVQPLSMIFPPHGYQSNSGGNVRIVAESASNSLLISGPKTKIEEVESMVKQLDRPPVMAGAEAAAMVRVDVTIADVDHGKVKKADDVAAEKGKAIDENAKGVLFIATASEEGTPQMHASVATLDNQAAQIFLGRMEPRVSGAAHTQGVATNMVTSISLGTQINLTPRVDRDKTVVLTLKISDSRSGPTEEDTVIATAKDGQIIRAPSTDQFTADTTVRLQDGKTLLLGGMTRDAKSGKERLISVTAHVIRIDEEKPIPTEEVKKEEVKK
jgi:hypothetical protein